MMKSSKQKPSASISASALSKMAFCEASVIKSAELSHLDRARIDRGNKEHKRFEKAVRKMASKNRSEARRSPCEVQEGLLRIIDPQEALGGANEPLPRDKSLSRGKYLLTLLIICGITIFLINII